MESSATWGTESFMIEIYFTLAHRIKGLGWSLTDFWSADTWTTSLLYCRELELIEKEEEELNKNKSKSNPEKFNTPEMENLHRRMFKNGKRDKNH